MDPVRIGLDIGSSAVRAAEIEVTKDGRRRLRRYGQVGLPHGFVVDGEVNNIPGVAAALRRLWAEAGFGSTRVVLGVSGPRVFVRQADVTSLSHEDLRSSLKFDGQELIPIPMEEACFDFSILDPDSGTDKDGHKTCRILIVAAHRDTLDNYLTTLRDAGLSAVAMDPAPLALMRAVPPAAEEGTQGTEVLVSIGAELTTVAVREAGVPRFIRSLTVGGAKLTETIASKLHLEVAAAERLKRGEVPGDLPQLPQMRKAVTPEMKELAEEIRTTVDFFVSQSATTEIDRMVLTGGGSLTEGLGAAVAGNLTVPVERLDAFASLDTAPAALRDDQLRRCSVGATTAVGLALWAVESPLIRLSVLPEEVAHAQRARRAVVMAGCGVGAAVVALAAAGAWQIISVDHARHQVQEVKSQVAALNTQVTQLHKATAVHAQVQSRAALVKSALDGDVDWVRVLGQLATVMPPNLHLSSFQGARTQTTAGSTSSSSQTGIGTVTFSVKGTGGLPAASAWLLGLQGDPDVTAPWVTGINVTANGGNVTFSSNGYLTTVAESNRSKAVKP